MLLIGADPFLLQSSDRLIALAAQHRIPAVYNTREFVAGGGSRDHATSLFFMSTAALEAAAHLPLQHDQLMSDQPNIFVYVFPAYTNIVEPAPHR